MAVPRSDHAKVINQLKRAGAAVIAYDVQFTEPTVPAQDNALIESVAHAGNVVLATTEADPNGKTNVFGGGPILDQIHARVGNTELAADGDGVVRRMAYAYQQLENFALVAAQAKTGHPISASAMAGTPPIDFRGPPGTIPSLSFSHVLRGQFNPATVRGRVVVVGVTAPSLQDVHPTAADQSKPMSGAELEANEIDTALRGFPRECAGRSRRPLDPAPGRRGTARLDAAAAPARFRHRVGGRDRLRRRRPARVRWRPDPPRGVSVVALALSTIAVITVAALRDAVERQRVRDLFARFVPAQVVDEAVARADGEPRLGGVRREATVLFSDLRGFTAFAERLEPDRVIEVLNHYLTDERRDHGQRGHAGRFMGDGIMAVFGAPVPRTTTPTERWRRPRT